MTTLLVQLALSLFI